MSCAFENRELLVALATGEVVVCKFGKTTETLGYRQLKITVIVRYNMQTKCQTFRY